jgi:hypothetical protein
MKRFDFDAARKCNDEHMQRSRFFSDSYREHVGYLDKALDEIQSLRSQPSREQILREFVRWLGGMGYVLCSGEKQLTERVTNNVLVHQHCQDVRTGEFVNGLWTSDQFVWMNNVKDGVDHNEDPA